MWLYGQLRRLAGRTASALYSSTEAVTPSTVLSSLTKAGSRAWEDAITSTRQRFPLKEMFMCVISTQKPIIWFSLPPPYKHKQIKMKLSTVCPYQVEICFSHVTFSKHTGLQHFLLHQRKACKNQEFLFVLLKTKSQKKKKH